MPEPIPAKIGSILIRPAKRLAVGLLVVTNLFLIGALSAVGAAENPKGSKKESHYSSHDYTFRLRPTAWAVFVEGDFETRNIVCDPVSVSIDGDLGYDETYPVFSGEASFRWGKHDLWITGILFDESESAPINIEFELGDEIFNVGGIVDSETSVTDVNFRYGYSFFTFQDDGFRLGPTVAVSYTEIDFKITELTISGIPTGGRFDFEETVPVPTIGFHAEVPFGDVVLSAQAGGFYFEVDDFSGSGFRAEVGATWRPYDHIGFFGGLYAIYADLELNDEDLNDFILWGPAVGLEIRF